MSFNERKTEKIVSRHFDGDTYKKVLVEEQKSDIPKISKLLKYASKKGGGRGCPEFIITFQDSPGFIIVIECKGDVTKHQSKTLDRYADFAVDGVLLYSSFLSKEYDVLSIAVSGQTQAELRVSHYLQLQGEPTASEFDLGNKLLGYESYLKSYLASPQKHRQDYYALIEYSRRLNNKLQSHSILANQRGLFFKQCINST